MTRYHAPSPRWIRRQVAYHLRHILPRLLCLAIGCIAIAWPAGAADVDLEWLPSPSAGVASYRIYQGTNSGLYSAFHTFSRTNRAATITGLDFGRWYFAATAMGSNGLESAMSNEVSTNAPMPAPQITRISGPADALILQSAPSSAGPWKTLAVITSSNQPLQLTAAPKQFFRTIATNLPPLPGGGQ